MSEIRLGISEKFCTSCLTTKPIKQFYKHKNSKDGYTCTCKTCFYAGIPSQVKVLRAELAAQGNAKCSKCRVIKPVTAFHKNPLTTTGVQTWCKECTNAAHRSRRRMLKCNWSEEEVANALIAQNGKCAICGGVNANGRALAADHCHATNSRRKLLCFRCNLVLGHVNDDPTLLTFMINYLQECKGNE